MYLFAGKQHTRAWWVANNPIIELDQLAVETDTLRVKYGDGVTAYNDLCFSGFRYVNNNLIVDWCFDTSYKDTIINDNEFILRDRPVDGNSITIKDYV